MRWKVPALSRLRAVCPRTSGHGTPDVPSPGRLRVLSAHPVIAVVGPLHGHNDEVPAHLDGPDKFESHEFDDDYEGYPSEKRFDYASMSTNVGVTSVMRLAVFANQTASTPVRHGVPGVRPRAAISGSPQANRRFPEKRAAPPLGRAQHDRPHDHGVRRLVRLFRCRCHLQHKKA